MLRELVYHTAQERHNDNADPCPPHCPINGDEQKPCDVIEALVAHKPLTMMALVKHTRPRQ